MRQSDTHSVAVGVMPTGSGVIWAKAYGIGYNTLYLNPLTVISSPISSGLTNPNIELPIISTTASAD